VEGIEVEAEVDGGSQAQALYKQLQERFVGFAGLLVARP